MTQTECEESLLYSQTLIAFIRFISAPSRSTAWTVGKDEVDKGNE